MAFTHLKSITTKVNAKVRSKLQSIKLKVLKTKTKATNVNEATNINMALNVNQAAKNNAATAVDKADVATTTITKVANVQPSDVKPAGEVEVQLASKEHGERKLKRRAPISDSIDDSRPHKKVRYNEQGPLVEQNQANEVGVNVGAPVTSPVSQKSDKKAARAARREARKARWAVRRTAFKTKVKKVLDASITPGMIALVTIFSPVIMALSIVGFVLHSVIMLIIHVLDCLCAPVMLCIWWPFD